MSHPHIPACSLQDRLKWTIREASALAVNDGLTDPPPQAKRVARRSRSLSGKWHGPATSVFFVGLEARSAAMPCASQATRARRKIPMSLRVARGRGAAASRRLDDGSTIAGGAAPNIAPSSCNAGPCHFPDRLLGGLIASRVEAIDPPADPFDRDFLGDGAGAGVVQHRLADAPRAQRLQQRVEALAAEAEGLRIGAVAEADDAVAHPRQIRLRPLEVGEEGLRIVGHVALAVGRGAYQESAVAGEDRRVEPVHGNDRGGDAARLQGIGHLVGDELRRAGHGADQDGQALLHAGPPWHWTLQAAETIVRSSSLASTIIHIIPLTDKIIPL